MKGRSPRWFVYRCLPRMATVACVCWSQDEVNALHRRYHKLSVRKL